MINIYFKQDHKAHNFATSPNPTRETMRQLASTAVGGSSSLKEYRFVIGCKQLDLEDEAKFEAARYLLTDNCTIFVLMRMLGGGFIEVSLLWDILLSELDSLLERAPKHMRECVVCMADPEPCVKVCCSYVCVEHLRQNFRTNDAKYVCYGSGLGDSAATCSKRLDLGAVLESASFSAAIKQFEETQQLMKHINCQVCRCGRFMINETLWAKQRCACERTFCFFCNRDWQPGTMNNMLYHCSDSCDYKTRLSHELVPLAYNKEMKVPNRRCCPFCFVLGGYDQKCKYHTCTSCKKSFCFICLKAEADCKREYNSRYDHQCTTVVKQRFEDFPHLPL